MSPPNTHTLLIFLQDNIPREALQIVARGTHKRTGRSLTAVQGRLRSSPLPLKVPPSDPPPLSPSPLSSETESNEKTRGFHAILPTQPKPPRQRQAFHAVKNEVLHLFRQPFSVRDPLPHRGKGVKEEGVGGRNQKREASRRCSIYIFSIQLSEFRCPIEGKESRKRGGGGETKRGKGDVSPLDEHARPCCGVSPEQYYVAFPFRSLNNRRNRCLFASPQTLIRC